MFLPCFVVVINGASYSIVMFMSTIAELIFSWVTGDKKIGLKLICNSSRKSIHHNITPSATVPRQYQSVNYTNRSTTEATTASCSVSNSDKCVGLSIVSSRVSRLWHGIIPSIGYVD